MPPKRKATTSAADNTPPVTRRRTRAAETASDAPATIKPVVEEPPAKRTRRRAKAEDEPTPAERVPQVFSSANPPTVATSKAPRSTTRGRKAAAPNSQGAPESQPSVPKRKGRAKKALPEEVEEEPTQEEIPRPLSPIQEKALQPVPKKRGRPKKTDDTAEHRPSVPEGSRPKRVKRAKSPTAVKSTSRAKVQPSTSAVQEEPQSPASQEVSPSTPKKRGRRKVAPAADLVKVSPLQVPLPTKTTAAVPIDETEGSEDELLLTPSRRVNVRPTTPTRTGGSRIGNGTPRMFLHSVEITTPRRMLATVRRDLGSPGPRVSHVRPLGTPRLPPAFPSAGGSPSKRNVIQPPPSTSKQRTARTPQPVGERLPTVRPPESPSRVTRHTAASPTPKRQNTQVIRPFDDLPTTLPERLHPLLERQKRAILKSLQRPPEIDEIDIYGEDYPPANTLAYEQLGDLLAGTVERGEGNSCLLIGPSGSGKTEMVEKAISALASKPIVVRLSGYAQQNDRLAIREIAWQLAQQTGQSFLPAQSEDEGADEDEAVETSAPAERERDDDPDEDENPFVMESTGVPPTDGTVPVVTLPPPAHLLALISMIPTLPRPTIMVLDGFDLFANHARQALLYCLLDTAQACRTGTGSGSGMAVVGVTARVDTINILEKRVKSRFSGRMIRTACPTKVEHWVSLAKAALSTTIVGEGVRANAEEKEWAKIWTKAVEQFVSDEEVLEILRETYALTRDFQTFRRLMTSLVLELDRQSPYPTSEKLEVATTRQRCPSRLPALHTLPYPAICLLIASVHAQTSGHDTFTFEMLHEAFKSQVRTSQSAPVQVEGGGIGMVRCSREVLFSALERLVDLHVFLPAAAPAASIAKEFVLYRSAVDRFEVKKAVESVGQMSLKKWFLKA